MPRSRSFLNLVQFLRRASRERSERRLASDLGTTLRELHRDVAAATAGTARRRDAWLAMIRHAIRTEQNVVLRHRDESGGETEHVSSPFLIDVVDDAPRVIAWCEPEHDVRAIRADDIVQVALTGEAFPLRRRELLRAWRERYGSA